MAPIAFDSKVLDFVPSDHSKRANHDACPATNASLFLSTDKSFLISIETATDAGIQAGSILAVTTDNRHLHIGRSLYEYPPAWGWSLRKRS